jgi:hypothetical protein
MAGKHEPNEYQSSSLVHGASRFGFSRRSPVASMAKVATEAR